MSGIAASIPYAVFYVSLGFVLYVYLGYPAFLLVWGRIAGRKVQKSTDEPTVSIIIAAFNEAAVIERKILNLLELDYPSSRMQIILALDGPTDDTESIARKYEVDTARMQVLALRHHGGKAEALNQAVEQASGSILVFGDARQLLDRAAIRALVSNFSDPSVGGVTGELMLVDNFGKESGDAVGLYWRYEKALRSIESDIHSTLGATGALYAIRRELYKAIPPHTILDDVAIPMNVVLGGKRIVFERAARAFDFLVSSTTTEFTRKVRTLSGNFQLLKQMPELLLPWRNPVFVQFVSHKVGRLLVPYFLMALFLANPFLHGAAYRGILALQCGWYLLACAGAVIARGRRSTGGRMRNLLLFPYTFLLMNWAAVVGLHHFLRKQPDVWSGRALSRNSLMPPGRMLLPEVINSEKGFEEIREEWAELLAHSSSDCIFLTWEWLHTWWKHFAGRRNLHVLVIRDGKQVIAIAPLASISTILTRLTRVRTLEFLGTGSVGSDYLDIIARRGSENQAIEVLADYFRREQYVVDLKQILADHSLALKLAAVLKQEQWKSSEIRTNVCPFIDLAGQTWKSFLAGLGPNHRYNFHRRLKNLHRNFEAKFECVAAEDKRSAALRALVELHNKRMQDRGGSDGLHSSELVAFHEELTRLALVQGWLRLFVLTLNGERAAALYGFSYSKKFYFYQSGFDPRYLSHSVGLVTMGLAIEAAIEGGAEEFDLLHGNEKYKSLWAREHRDLGRLELYPPTSRASMYSGAIGLNRLARRAARHALTMLQPGKRSNDSMPDKPQPPVKAWSEAK